MASEFPSILQSLLVEEWNEQILKKIPYSILIGILLYYFNLVDFLFQRFSIFGVEVYLFPGVITFLLGNFLVENWYFNDSIIKTIKEELYSVDFSMPLSYMNNIFENRKSFIDDFFQSGHFALIFAGIISGLSLSLLFAMIFLFVLKTVIIPIEIVGVIFLLTILIIYQELTLKPKERKKDENENQVQFVEDMMYKYIYENSQNSLLIKKSSFDICQNILGRILAPVVNIKIPNLAFYQFFLIKNTELTTLLIEELSNSDNDMFLKSQNKEELQHFLAKDHTGFDLKDVPFKCQKELFPYLYTQDRDPNTTPNGTNDFWIILDYCFKPENRKVGRIVIQQFQGAWIPYQVRKVKWLDHTKIIDEIEKQHKKMDCYLFILYGERAYIDYLKIKIESVSPRVNR